MSATLQKKMAPSFDLSSGTKRKVGLLPAIAMARLGRLEAQLVRDSVSVTRHRPTVVS